MLSVDTGDDDAACIAFDELHGIEFPTISGVEGGGTAICNTYGVGAYPTYILIAPDHSIVEQDIWPVPSAQTFIGLFESHGLQEASCDQTLTALFTSDVTEVCEANDVSFSDASVGDATSWNWTFEGGDPATSTDQNPTVTYNSIGTFNVELEVSDGTETNSVLMEDYITVNACTGIIERDEIGLNIFPNPTNGEFKLELNHSGDISIKVYNMLGVVVYEQEENASGKFTKSIDLNGMEDGIYFISVQVGDKIDGRKLKLLSK